MSITGYPEHAPRHHAAITRQMLTSFDAHTHTTASKLDDPRAQALFATTEHVLTGLSQALPDYEHRRTHQT